MPAQPTAQSSMHLRLLQPSVLLALGLAVVAPWALNGPSAGAQQDYAATAAWAQIGLGARALAMGGCFVALADDASALYYNPAGLAAAEGYEITSFYSTEYGLSSFGALGVAGPGLGGGITHFGSSGIPETDALGNEIAQFDYGAGSGMLAMATRWDGLLLGGSLTYVVDQPHRDSGTGLTASLGALLDLGTVRLGAVGRHLVGEVRYASHAEAFDPAYVVGVAAPLGGVTVAVEYETLASRGSFVRVGAEDWITDSFALRGGAWYDLASGELNASAGFGARLHSVAIDYAYYAPRRLPATHRLALTLLLPTGTADPGEVRKSQREPETEPGVELRGELANEPGITLIGRVVDSQGNPLHRVLVEAWQSWENRYASSANHWNITDWQMPIALTDENGYFRLEGIVDYSEMKSRTYYIVFKPRGEGWAHTGFYLPLQDHRDGAVIDWGTITVHREVRGRR